MKKKTLKINFPPSEKYLPSTRLAIAGMANQANLSVQDIAEIKKALTDACQLAIENTYCNDKKAKSIQVECSLNKQALDIRVKNHCFKIDIHRTIKA